MGHMDPAGTTHFAMVAWLVEKLWSLKCSKIRGLKHRTTSKDLQFQKGLKQCMPRIDEPDRSTPPGSLRMSLPGFSRMSSPMSPDLLNPTKTRSSSGPHHN